MAAPSIAVSETVLLAATTEQHFSKNVYYRTIVVDNSGDSAGTGLTANNFEIYVCTDGGTATVGGASCEMVPYGQTRVFSNLQPLPNPNVSGSAAVYQNGFTNSGTPTPNSGPGSFDQSGSVGWTAQSGNAVTGNTYCSVISAGTPEVTITFE